VRDAGMEPSSIDLLWRVLVAGEHQPRAEVSGARYASNIAKRVFRPSARSGCVKIALAIAV
jgi:hypothetical protein